MKFRLLSDRVVVRGVKEEEKTTGGIIQTQSPGIGGGGHGATAAWTAWASRTSDRWTAQEGE